MAKLHRLRLAVLAAATAAVLAAQGVPPIRVLPPLQDAPLTPQQEAQRQAQQQMSQQAPQGTQPGQPPRLASSQGFLLGGVPLSEMIETIGKMLKLNFIVDGRVNGKVTIYTYGEVK